MGNKTNWAIMILLISILFLSIKIGNKDRTIERHNQTKDFNLTIEGKITEIRNRNLLDQSPIGNLLYPNGIEITYEFTFKNVLFEKTEHIPNKQQYLEVIKRCTYLNIHDNIEIRLDSLNPINSLIYFN